MIASFRRVLHCCAARSLHGSGLLAVRDFARRGILRKREVCVLVLHRVLDRSEWAQSSSPDGMIIREATFAALIEDLHTRFQFISLQELLTSVESGQNFPRPACHLTFDDGWRDNYTTAYPWLKKLGVPATIFLVTGMLDSRGGFWVERLVRAWRDPAGRRSIESKFGGAVRSGQTDRFLDHVIEYLKRRPARERRALLEECGISGDGKAQHYPADRMLSWPEIREMSRGGVEFGSHTVTHPLLTYEEDGALAEELRASKQTLEEGLGKPVRAFAYPNGDCNHRVRRTVQEAGYALAFTTERDIYHYRQDLYTIPRIMLHEGCVTGLNGEFSPSMLSLRLSAWH